MPSSVIVYAVISDAMPRCRPRHNVLSPRHLPVAIITGRSSIDYALPRRHAMRVEEWHAQTPPARHL